MDHKYSFSEWTACANKNEQPAETKGKQGHVFRDGNRISDDGTAFVTFDKYSDWETRDADWSMVLMFRVATELRKLTTTIDANFGGISAPIYLSCYADNKGHPVLGRNAEGVLAKEMFTAEVIK